MIYCASSSRSDPQLGLGVDLLTQYEESIANKAPAPYLFQHRHRLPGLVLLASRASDSGKLRILQSRCQQARR